MKYKIFSRLIKKNSILMIMPLAGIILMVSLVAFRLSELKEFNSFKLDDISYAESFINDYKMNVSYDISGAEKAGYDYTINGEKAGEYYYLYRNDSLYFIVLRDSDIKKFETGNKVFYFRITTDDLFIKQVTADLSDSFDENPENLNGFVNPIILNAFEYPYIRLISVPVIFYISVFFGILVILYILLILIRPSVSVLVKPLAQFGKKKDVIKELDEELESKVLYCYENCYVTENYLVIIYVSRLEIVRLDDIKYLSKHVEEKKGLLSNGKIFRLTASNVDKLYFEHDFDSEEAIDQIIYYIRREDIVDETEEVERNDKK